MKQSSIFAVKVSPLTHQAEVIYDKNSMNPSVIIKEISNIGFGAEVSTAPDIVRLSVQINNYFDFVTLKQQLTKKKGVSDVHSKEPLVLIDYNPQIIGPRTLLNFINELGYDACISSEKAGPSKVESNIWKYPLSLSVVLCIPVVLISFIFPTSSTLKAAFNSKVVSGLSVETLLVWMLATPIQFWVGKPLYVSAYKALRYTRAANVDTLVMLSTSTAYFYSVISAIISMADSSYDGTFIAS